MASRARILAPAFFAMIASSALAAAPIAAAANDSPAKVQPAGQPSNPLAAPGDPFIDLMVQGLGASSLTQRESSERALLNSNVSLASLEAALHSRKLDAEQRVRLERVCLSRFSTQPRAALGIQFAQEVVEALGPEINQTYPQFDSHRLLKAGDVIYALGGVRVNQFNDVRKIIMSFLPGEQIDIHILRDAEPLKARVTLGVFANLPNLGGRDRFDFGDRRQEVLAAWSLRMQRLGASAGASPIDTGLTRRDVEALGQEIDKKSKPASPMGDLEHIMSVTSQEQARADANSVHAGGQPGVIRPEAIEQVGSFRSDAPMDDFVKALFEERKRIDTNIMRLQSLLRAARLNQAQEANFRAQLENLRDRRKELDHRLRNAGFEDRVVPVGP